MAVIVGVRFKEFGKTYYFDPCGHTLKEGSYAIVETARGMECGYVTAGNHEVPEEQIVQPLKKVVRLATPADKRQMEENQKKAEEAFVICQQKIAQHKLDMKLIEAEYVFDRSKILFYFLSENRVDFRELVKDLASEFRTRIELRQVGVRDEAKMLGGYGICGQPFCCATFLPDFQPVSIKMAKEQNLSLNPTKISGSCGRLMCCLKYEQDTYEELHKITPRVGSSVETPQGKGTVADAHLLTGNLKVQLDAKPDGPLAVFHRDQVKRCNGCGRANKPQNNGNHEQEKPKQ